MSISVQVECYSGYTYADEPRAFVWRAHRYEVKRVIKRWRTPAGPGFRVQVFDLEPGQESDIQKPDIIPAHRLILEGDGRVDLQYIEVEDKWTLEVHTSIQEDQR